MICNGIARWNGSVWQPLGAGTGGGEPYVKVLAVYNGELVAGGTFTAAGGLACNRIARWNGSIWQPLGDGMNSFVYSLTVHNGELIAGGGFTAAGDHVSVYWARWPCPPPCGDLSGPENDGLPDNSVNVYDYWYMRSGMGYCNPHTTYVQYQAADLDGDGCITFVDYQMWIECYRQANGREFVPPKKRTATPIELQEVEGGVVVGPAPGVIAP